MKGGGCVGGGGGGKNTIKPQVSNGVEYVTPLRGAQKITKLIKPVLNWANVCSPNILRTVRRTYDSFLN